MATDAEMFADAQARYGRGDLAGADALAAHLLARHPQDAALAWLAGMIAAQTGRWADAIRHLPRALAAAPADLASRTALAFAYVNSGAYGEARRVVGDSTVPQLRRIAAFADQCEGRTQAAIAGYRTVLASFPEDAETLHNLGRLLTDEGDLAGATEALERSLALRADPAVAISLSRALARGERHEERRAVLRHAAAAFGGDASLLVELGLAEAANSDFAAAETAYRAALVADPNRTATYLEYGMMLEALNRLDDLERLVASARAKRLAGPELDFVEAWLLKRRGRFTEALQKSEAIEVGINPIRAAQLRGDLLDRLDDPAGAFAAFGEMNRLSALGPAAAHARARDFPGEIATTIRLLTPAWAERIGAARPTPSAAPPIFVLGFPRSGTTLLDTMLMNLPELEVLEEAPMLERVEERAGGMGALAGLKPAEIEVLERDYWAEAVRAHPVYDRARTLVDKFPLHLVRVPLIYRLFPSAPIVFVERHPCDVVLSCFMARFQTNRATVHFHGLESAARLYDLAMQAWTRAAELLPIKLHRVRYERLAADPESEMRPLLEFLDLPWRDTVLDNRSSAARRAHIATASYAQVADPIHTRAVARWERYRTWLEPVLPILAPWAERAGYPL